MTKNVGTIKYTVEAETGDLLTAEKVVDNTTNAMAKDFEKMDNAADKTAIEIKKSAKAVKTALIGEQKAAERAAAAIVRTKKKETDAFNKSAAKKGRAMGQTGIQIQQFVGQVQGGQNALLAFSQQAADIGIVSGHAMIGVVLGIAASLVGILLPALFKTTEATKDFTFAVADSAKELENLEDMTKNQISVAMRNTSKSMDELSEAAVNGGEKIAALNSRLDRGTKEAVTYTRSGTAIIEVIKLTEKETKKLTESLEDEMANLDKINQEYKRESDLLVELSKNKDGFSKKTKKQKEATAAFKSTLELQLVSLEQQAMALENGEEAAFRWATAQRLGMKDGELFEESIDQRIAAIFKLKAAQDKAKEDEAKQEEGVQFSEGFIAKSTSPADKMKADMERLIALRDTDLENTAIHQQAITALEQQGAEERTKIKDDQFTAELARNNLILSSSGELFGALAGLLDSHGDEQSGAYKAMFAISKGFAIAQSLLNLSTAVSQASILPFPVNIPAMASAAASGASLVSAISSASFSGRQFGGGVSGGNAYRMGENGTEILKQGNKHIVIPGENGSVVPNNELGGGGVTVNINNMASGVDVQAQPSPDGKTIEIAVRQAVNEMTSQVASGNGRFMNALKGNTNVTTKASR